MNERACRAGRWVCILALLAPLGCEVAPSTRKTAQGLAETRQPPPRIPKAVLSDLGLEELWYAEPPEPSDAEIGLVRAWLLDEGLFVVTRPRPEHPTRYLKRIDLETGYPMWILDIEAIPEHRPTAYRYPESAGKPDELFFTILDTVHCVDLRYGDELWFKTLRFPVSTPLAANETHIFAGSDNHRCYAVRKNWSLPEWTHLTGGKIQAAPLLVGPKAIFASHDGRVYGLEATRGWAFPDSWERETGARILADMAEYSNWVFVGSMDYKLYCLESLDGAVVWSFVAEAPIIDPPVVYKYKANQEFVYCIAARGPIANPKRTLFAIPLPKGRQAVRGEAIWQVEGIRRVVSIGKETLYVLKERDASGNWVLAGLEIETGREKFALPLKGFHFVPTNTADAGRDPKLRGRIYLISATGAMQALQEKL